MGQFMGIYEQAGQRAQLIEQGPAEAYVKRANIYPENPSLTIEAWEAIQSFYLNEAPATLNVDSISWSTTDLFKIEYPDLYFSPPSVTYVDMEEGKLSFADANKQFYFQLNSDLSIAKQAKIGEGIVDVEIEQNQYWITVMGSFSPTDSPSGYVYRLSSDPNIASGKVIDLLQRPVHSTLEDFDQNGTEELLICEYGKWTGALSLWQQSVEGKYSRSNIENRPGAISTHLLDINADGLQDFIALFGQGAESIKLYLNQGSLRFEAKELVSLPSSMGSSALSLFDYNEDGKMDLLYTAGDNADYPPVMKPYHGIYVYTQGADFSFEQSLFLPLPGAYRAIAKDFDQDGDLDIAAISFFPDYYEQAIGFVFYENTGADFVAKCLPLRQNGRWLVMDSGDIDQDGDEDLILGSLTFEAPQKPDLVNYWVENGLPFVILKNTLK